MKLKQKLLLPIIGIIVFTTVTLQLITYYQIKNSLINNLVLQQLNSSLGTIEDTVRSNEEAINVTKSGINEKNIFLTKAIAELIRQNPSLLSFDNMVSLAKTFNITEIHVTDENGVLTNGNIKEFYGFDFKTTDQTKPFIKILEDKNFTLAQEPSERGTDKKLFQYIGVARVDKPGIVQIGVEPQVLEDLTAKMKVQNLIEKIHIGDSGFAFIIDTKGVILAHKNKSEIGKNTTETKWAQEILQNKNGNSKMNIDGKNYYVGYKADGEKINIACYAEAEVMPALNRLRTEFIIMIFVIIILVTIVLFVIINKQLINPINILLTSMSEVGNGNLNTIAKIKSNDEIGMLGKNFNNMVNDLRNLVKDVTSLTYTLKDSANTIVESSEEVSVASSEIASTVQEIAQGASNQAQEASTSLTLTNQLAERITSITERLEETSTKTVSMQKKNVTGMEALNLLEEKLKDTTDASITIAEKVNNMSEKSKSIALIVEAIQSISSQTNLLALNAAIEAARAGEQGRGFAVVAEEVRKLAEQSNESTVEIKKIIDEITSNISETNEVMETAKIAVKNANSSLVNTKGAFNEIEDSVVEVVSNVNILNKDINFITKAKDTVLQSIENISSIAEESAASTEEISASSEEQTATIEEITSSIHELNNMVNELSNSISKFKF